MRNSEFGIIYAPYVCHENLNYVGADSISTRFKLTFYPNISVGDGSPVQHRKTFHNKWTSLFSSDKPVDNRDVFVKKLYAENCCRNSGQKAVPYGNFTVIVGFSTGGYRIRPYEIGSFAIN